MDFLAIECIRVFEPKVYDGIRRNSELFCGVAQSGMGSSAETELEKKQISKILKSTTVISSQDMEYLLSRLFLKLESILGNTSIGSDFYEEWRKKKRVCSKDFFLIYFRSSLPSDSISTSEIKKILDYSSDREKLSNWFNELLLKKLSTGRSELSLVLNRITDYFDDLKDEQIKNILIVIFDIGDRLSIPEDVQEGMYGISGGNDRKLEHIVYRLLPLLEEKIRFNILKEAYSTGNSVHLMSEAIIVFGRQNGKYGSDSTSENPFISLEQVKELEDISLEKIRDSVKNSELKLDSDIVGLLYIWKEWSANNEAVEWLEGLIEKDSNNTLLLLNAFISSSYSHGWSDRVAKKHTKINIKGIAEFIDISSFAERVTSLISKKDLGSNEKALVELFQDNYQKYVDGDTDEF